MHNPLDSNWTVRKILTSLCGFRRVDDGADLLAFRMAGLAPRRFVYVYLYGDNPDLIHYDLENLAIDTDEWDHAVERRSLCSAEELRDVCERWLVAAAMSTFAAAGWSICCWAKSDAAAWRVVVELEPAMEVLR